MRTLLYDAAVFVTDCDLYVCGIAFDKEDEGSWNQSESIEKAWIENDYLCVQDVNGHVFSVQDLEPAPGVYKDIYLVLAMAFLESDK